MEQKQYRHGDVYLREAVIPITAKKTKRDHGHVVLAYGEVTGHAHRIKERTVQMWSAGDQRYITVPAEGETVRPGTFAIVARRHKPEPSVAWLQDGRRVWIEESDSRAVIVGQQLTLVHGVPGVTHEEHDTEVFAPRTYEMIQQREYDYLAEMPRAVAD